MLSRVIPRGGAAFATLLLAASPAFALMSPYYESATVIERILGDSSLADSLKQQAILTIVQSSQDVWEIRTAECSITVNVVDVAAPADEPAMAGARNFDVKFGAPNCQ
jgi:hypothetical protein